MEKNKPLINAAKIIILSSEKKQFKKAVFSKPDSDDVKKAEMRPISIGGNPALQYELFTADNKAYHRNMAFPLKQDDIAGLVAGYKQVNIMTEVGDCEYKRSKSGNETLIGGDKLISSLNTAEINDNTAYAGNNKEKDHILTGDEPFLKLLGVSDAGGRVYDKKQAKFRQINKFLEHIGYVERFLPNDSIRICDLCCGKSYLSFAVYYYFAKIKKMNVSMTGVDLKKDVIEYCSETAKKLSFDRLEFICGDIREYKTKEIPQLVISLHACDTATDVVLEKATEWGSDVILSTPCCHHELNHTLNCPELSFIADYSMLKQKLCDAATDAMRLKRLEAYGYKTAALELIDPEETPKNIMLRAIKNKNFSQDSEEAHRKLEEYERIKKFLVQ